MPKYGVSVMHVREAIVNRRTVRSFCQKPVSTELLTEICGLARLYANGGNLQPICFQIINNQEICSVIFSNIYLAAYLPEYRIGRDEQPPAYIAILTDRTVSEEPQFEAGAASTNIMLLAKEKGLDTCCIGNFKRDELARILHVNTDKYKLMYLLGVGKSEQRNTIESMKDTVKYRYEGGKFIVPKRNISDVLLL